jgi:hypothetical protein
MRILLWISVASAIPIFGATALLVGLALTSSAPMTHPNELM